MEEIGIGNKIKPNIPSNVLSARRTNIPGGNPLSDDDDMWAPSCKEIINCEQEENKLELARRHTVAVELRIHLTYVVELNDEN